MDNLRQTDAALAKIDAAQAARRIGEKLRNSGSMKSDRFDVAAMPAPEPLRRPLPSAAVYPIACLGSLLAPTAQRLHEVVKAPGALCGQSILAAASLAAQKHADVVVDGRREPLSLWAVSIAESGERKSAADRIALLPHRDFERCQLEKYKTHKAEHDTNMAAYESACRTVSKGDSLDEIKHALMGVGEPPVAPLKPLLLVSTPTIEGIHKQYADGQPNLGLFHDDAGEFLGGHTMNRDNRLKSAAGLSRLWDCGEFDRVRAGDGAEKYYGRRFAMHLMLQPIIAEAVLSDDVLTGQGFLARCLLAWPKSTIGSREYAEIDLTSDPDLIRYQACMRALLEREPPLRPGTANELEPRLLQLSADAKARWIQIHNAIERDMRAGADFSDIRAWASKAPAQTLRIAGVLTLVSDPAASVISCETIDAAASLTSFHLSEAARIVGTASVPAEVRHAEALLSWCHASGTRYLHSGAALQYGPGAIRTRKVFDVAIDQLERALWAVPVDGGEVLDGARRKRVWLIRSTT